MLVCDVAPAYAPSRMGSGFLGCRLSEAWSMPTRAGGCIQDGGMWPICPGLGGGVLAFAKHLAHATTPR